MPWFILIRNTIGRQMATKVTKVIKREVSVNGQPHTLQVTEAGVVLTRKGCRNGKRISYESLMNGTQPPQDHKG
jgi:hypothetical protein